MRFIETGSADSHRKDGVNSGTNLTANYRLGKLVTVLLSSHDAQLQPQPVKNPHVRRCESSRWITFPRNKSLLIASNLLFLFIKN